MKVYMFTDCIIDPHDSNVECDNSYREIECDISGEQYVDLIRLCCKYSSVFSVIVHVPDMDIVVEMDKFRIDRPENIQFKHGYYMSKNTKPNSQFYKVCPELCDIIIEKANSIYEWLNGWGFRNPEDPTFYREDGSVFFTSVIHDGEVFLLPRDDEDVSIVINNKYWREVDPNSITQRQINFMLNPSKMHD